MGVSKLSGHFNWKVNLSFKALKFVILKRKPKTPVSQNTLSFLDRKVQKLNSCNTREMWERYIYQNTLPHVARICGNLLHMLIMFVDFS